jgi:hypothetical protein
MARKRNPTSCLQTLPLDVFKRQKMAKTELSIMQDGFVSLNDFQPLFQRQGGAR